MTAMMSSLLGRIGFTGMSGLPGSRTAAANVFLVPFRISTAKWLPRLRLRVSSLASVVETRPQDPVTTVEDGVTAKENILACPVCYQRPRLIGPPISLNMMSRMSLQCETCKKTYLGNETHVDLIVSSGLKECTESASITTEFFRGPLISYIYERGWRQGFSALAGYPGPEKEFEMMKEYLRPVLGGNIIDASCGSGQFTRLFAKSGLFSQVIALDYSENMLRECYKFIKKDKGCPQENVALVRADISRLPFATGSIDSVHAGAALHCWSSPSDGVAEVSRVLRPGGVFVATTVILDGPYSRLPFLKSLRTNIYQQAGSNIFLSEGEMDDLCVSCGLTMIKCVRNRRFVMIVASKPT